jgi:hypothetical protein
MRVLLLSGLVVLLATPTLARNFCDYPDIVPPAQYDYEPTVHYTVYNVPLDFLKEIACPGNEAMRAGCAVRTTQPPDPEFWSIYIRRDVTPEERECILRHEKAHLNGWRHRNGPR